MKVLHVDSDPAWQRVVSGCLDGVKGVTLKTVSHSLLVNYLFQKPPCDLVVLEPTVVTPLLADIHGLCVVNLLSKHFPNASVLILSSFLTVDVIYQAALMPSVVEVIPKRGVPSSEWLRWSIVRNLDS